MRYYKVAITDSNGNPVYLKSLGSELTSLLATGAQNPQQGITNGAALQVEFDLPVSAQHVPMSNAWLRVWGVGIPDLNSAASFTGNTIQVYAGMAQGLPLATQEAANAGLLISGTIFQSFGNWVGVDQYIDFVIIGGGIGVGSTLLTKNYPFIWPANTTMAQALTQTLQTALPNLMPVVQISPNLVQGFPDQGHYTSLAGLSDALNKRSRAILGAANYQGVSIAIVGNTVLATDGTAPSPTTRMIQPIDLIGQPTWIAPNNITFRTVMRADLNIGDIAVLPQTIFQSNPQSYQQSALTASNSGNATLTFQGKFAVTSVRHIGNFRQPQAEAWNTTFQAYRQT